MKELKRFINEYNHLIDILHFEMEKVGAELDFRKLNDNTQSFKDYGKIQIIESIRSSGTYSPHHYFTVSDELVENDKYILFASNPNHDNFYAINKENEEIDLIDYHNPEYIYFKCGKNLLSFLDAQAEYLKFSSLLYTNKEKFNSNEYRRHTIETCVNQAGGTKYQKFYELIVPLVDKLN